MEEKTNKTFEITKDNLNYFRFLSDEEGALMLIKSYKAFINRYYKACQDFHAFFINIESKFLQEETLNPMSRHHFFNLD
jgi:hypothetical protein